MRTLCVWLLFGCLCTLACARLAEETFIGWKGNSYRPESQDTKMWIQSIAWKPRAFIIHNLINEDEARHIAATAAPTMKRSTVVGPNGSSVLDDYRTSWGTFVNRYETDIIKNVQDRVAQIVRVPVVHQEDMQVLRYAIGQYYHAHQDSLDNDSPRMATLLIYLADAEEGGETAFPSGSVWAHPDLERIYGSSFSDCARGHVGIRPRRGDALLFWSIEPDGHTDDPASTHEGCPVIRGAKWTTTIWVHTKPFRPEQYRKATNTFHLPKDAFTDPGFCQNGSGDDVCKGWAASGECKSNPGFMVAECALACKICVKCDSVDLPCYNENRRKAGYLVYSKDEFNYRRQAATAN